MSTGVKGLISFEETIVSLHLYAISVFKLKDFLSFSSGSTFSFSIAELYAPFDRSLTCHGKQLRMRSR